MRPVKKTLISNVILLFLLAVGLLSACGDDKEKNAPKHITIGIVNFTDALDSIIEAYKVAMSERGYIERENITYIYNRATNNIDDLDAEVQKLVDAHVDLILSISTPATLAAKRVTADTGIPVIFLPITDPIASGIVESMSQPGGNMTGVMTGQSGSKQLEWLKIIVPEIERVYIPYNQNDPNSSNAVLQVCADAEKLGLDPVLVETPDREAVLAALENMPEDIDAILVIPDSVVGSQLSDIIAFALERKLPLAASSQLYAEMGALLGFGSDRLDVGRQAARLTQQVLNGVPAGKLPVEMAENYLSINLQTADAIGITVPNSAVGSAKTVIR